MSDQTKTEACQNERSSFAASRGSASELEEYRDALRGCVNILKAVRYQVGLGKTQLERLTRAEQLLAKTPNAPEFTERWNDKSKCRKRPSSFAAPAGSALLPCPFCGGEAESDTMQAFRTLSGGYLSNAVAIYCTKCTAQVSMCHDDHKEYAPDDLLTILTDAWNLRVPNVEVSHER